MIVWSVHECPASSSSKQTLSEGMDFIEMPQFLSGQLHLGLRFLYFSRRWNISRSWAAWCTVLTQTVFFLGLTRARVCRARSWLGHSVEWLESMPTRTWPWRHLTLACIWLCTGSNCAWLRLGSGLGEHDIYILRKNALFLHKHNEIWSGCVIQLESEQTPYSWMPYFYSKTDEWLKDQAIQRAQL